MKKRKRPFCATFIRNWTLMLLPEASPPLGSATFMLVFSPPEADSVGYSKPVPLIVTVPKLVEAVSSVESVSLN